MTVFLRVIIVELKTLFLVVGFPRPIQGLTLLLPCLTVCFIRNPLIIMTVLLVIIIFRPLLLVVLVTVVF